MKFIHRAAVPAWACALIFTAILTGCAANSVRSEAAEERFDDAEMRALVTNLIQWIGEHSAYEAEPYLANPPQISFCRPNEEIAYEDRTVTLHEPAKGVFDLDRMMITLNEPWSKRNPNDVGTLLYELVHFVQYSSRQWECWRETEWEAYKLQELWLDQREIDPGFNWVKIFSCRVAPAAISTPNPGDRNILVGYSH